MNHRLVILVLAPVALILDQWAVPQHANVNSQAQLGEPVKGRAKNDDMARIPGSITPMGINPSDIERLEKVFDVDGTELFDQEMPRHTVTVGTFYLDKNLVTNSQFKNFVEANFFWQPDRIPSNLDNGNYLRHWKAKDNLEKANHPVVNVNWYAAVAYCRWGGKRLPTAPTGRGIAKIFREEFPAPHLRSTR